MARDAVAEVRDRTEIVDLVSSYVQLKKTGRSYKGLCPFHQEKTPSFVVFPESGNFHCFGCGRGGDVFTFYMGVEHVEFRDALQELAKRAGVELSSAPSLPPEVDAHRNRLIELNEMAAAFYANVLRNTGAGAAGRTVLEERGVSLEMSERFGLGFAPDGDALGRYLGQRGVDTAMAVEAGLLIERDNGVFRDRFWNRLLFPIRTREARTVGFGGRALGDAIPKYLNSAQSAIFDKSSLLYGLDLAQEAIRKADQVVIVEGYMDAIAAHQFGYANVVAAMGTAVTEQQIGLVKRLSRNIVLALDADAAGQGATIRSLEMLPGALDQDLTPVGAERDPNRPRAEAMIVWQRRFKTQISIVRLPQGKDPDELIRRDAESWPAVVASAQPFLDFYIDAALSGIDPGDAPAKAAAVRTLVPLHEAAGDQVVQAHYAGIVARKLQLPESSVLRELRRAAVRTTAPRSSRAAPMVVGTARASNENHLLALLLRYRSICQGILELVPVDDLADARNRELLRILQDPDIPIDLAPEMIVAGLDDAVADHAEALLERLEQIPRQFPAQIERDARRALIRLEKERFDYLMNQLHSSIAAAEAADDAEALTDLRHQLSALYERHRQFYPPRSPYFRDSRDGDAPHAASGHR
ncbi:MAG: primase [Thermomicrobiales bacterium]|nr:primase [Thermomicrobiales bacterium]